MATLFAALGYSPHFTASECMQEQQHKIVALEGNLKAATRQSAEAKAAQAAAAQRVYDLESRMSLETRKREQAEHDLAAARLEHIKLQAGHEGMLRVILLVTILTAEVPTLQSGLPAGNGHESN